MEFNGDDPVARRFQAYASGLAQLKGAGPYFHNQPAEEILGGAKVRMRGREMGMYASHSYLGLLGHPRANAASRKAITNLARAPMVSIRLPAASHSMRSSKRLPPGSSMRRQRSLTHQVTLPI